MSSREWIEEPESGRWYIPGRDRRESHILNRLEQRELICWLKMVEQLVSTRTSQGGILRHVHFNRKSGGQELFPN